MSRLSTLTEDLEPGHYLVKVSPGSTYIKPIDPNHAALAAAALAVQEKISHAIWMASEMKPTRPAVTEEQRRAWRAFRETLDDQEANLMATWESCQVVAESVAKMLMDETSRLLSNPMVAEAFEEFAMLCKISGDKQDE